MAPMSKLLVDTLRAADGGRVECDFATPDGAVVHSVIEKSFFDEFIPAPNFTMSAQRQSRIVQDNAHYIENEVDRQYRQGNPVAVIR